MQYNALKFYPAIEYYFFSSINVVLFVVSIKQHKELSQNKLTTKELTTMIDQRLKDILVCPKCKGDLSYKKPGNKKEPEELHCKKCKLSYAVIDDIPNMLIDDARDLSQD